MRSQRGFSLIELLIYVSVLAVVGGLLTGILYNSLRITNRGDAATEVSQQLSSVMGTIQKLVGDSSLIETLYVADGDLDPSNDPTEITGANDCDSGQNYCTLKLRFEADGSDPTWITADANGVYLLRDDDVLATTTLTSNAVTVDYLRFTKYEFGDGHASVRAEMAFTYNTDNEQFKITRALVSAIGRVTAATFDDHILPGGSSWEVGSSGNPWLSGFFNKLLIKEGDVGSGTSNYGTLYVSSSTGALHYVDENGTSTAIGPSIDTKCLWLSNPTASDDLQSIWTANGFGATLTKLWCESDQTVNADLQVDDGTPEDVDGTDLVCDTTPAEDEALAGDTTLADGDRLDLAITSVSGSPTWLSMCWTVRYDG